MDEADRLVVLEQLEALKRPDVPEDEQEERWATIKRLAPGVIAAGIRIIESLASAYIRSTIGL